MHINVITALRCFRIGFHNKPKFAIGLVAKHFIPYKMENRRGDEGVLGGFLQGKE